MSIGELIAHHHGPSSFVRECAARGLDIPMPTVRAWSARGLAHRQPPPWLTTALATLTAVPPQTLRKYQADLPENQIT